MFLSFIAKKNKLCIIFITVFNLYINTLSLNDDATNSLCNNLIQNYNSDEELSKYLKQNIDNNVLDFNIKPNSKLSLQLKDCIKILLSTGNYNSTKILLNKLLENKINFKDDLKKIILDIENNIKQLFDKYKFSEDEFQTVSPVIQWAQSLNNVYLHVKFSHRHDSPGCPEVQNLQVDLTPSKLYLTAYCIQTDIPIKFELILPFYVDVNVEESKHNHTSNGRYIFTMPKAKQGMFWDRLVLKNEDYPKHSKLWLDMHEKYKSEIEQFLNDDEEEEYQKLLEELGKKKKKNKRRKVKFE